jgi:hypothetical protein
MVSDISVFQIRREKGETRCKMITRKTKTGFERAMIIFGAVLGEGRLSTKEKGAI